MTPGPLAALIAGDAWTQAVETVAREFEDAADDADREGDLIDAKDDTFGFDAAMHRAYGARDAYRSAAKRVRGMGK